MSPDAAQPRAVWAISVQVARKMGGAWRRRTSVSGRDPRVAHILEPGTLNSLEFFPAAKLYLDLCLS
jgi:hypothetical protein